MTNEEAARILDPETRREALAEIEYYGGFCGMDAVIEASDEACRIASEVLRQTPTAHIDREAHMCEWVSVEGGNLPLKPDNGAWGRYIVSAVITNRTSIFEEPEETIHVVSAFYDHEQKIWHLDNELVINALCEPDGSPLCGDYVTHWMPLPERPDSRPLEEEKSQ